MSNRARELHKSVIVESTYARSEAKQDRHEIRRLKALAKRRALMMEDSDDSLNMWNRSRQCA